MPLSITTKSRGVKRSPKSSKGADLGYLGLAAKWEPAPISTVKEYDKAAALIDALAVKDEGTLSPGEARYLDALTHFVELYDRVHHPLEKDSRSTAERLRALLSDVEMPVNALAKVVGSQSLASMLVTGKREPSKRVIRLLAAYFKLEPAYFL